MGNLSMNQNQYKTPYIELDLIRLSDKYKEFAKAFKDYKIYYAVKANPHKEVIKLLSSMGSYFDTASIGEILDVLSNDVAASRISYGNTIKKEQDIAEAFKLGIRLFAVDSCNEVEKISRAAPGSDIFCRLLVHCEGAQWPLTRKFGCTFEKAIKVLIYAKKLGLNSRGLSFHVGSQQLNLDCWDKVIQEAADLFKTMQEHNITMDLLNLGGGFPISYINQAPSPTEIHNVIQNAINKYFGSQKLNLIIEPGRGMVGDCGIMYSEAVLISQKDLNSQIKWLFLDAGKFNGLIETLDESIRYKITVPNRIGKLEKFIIAGPTCDSADILYEKNPYELPNDIKIGDIVRIYGAGAYTSSYASVCFNGFAPIQTHIKKSV